jgi:hypothetical protein
MKLLPPLLRRRPFLLVICPVLVILGAALGVFFIRGPALILSDSYFEALYGPRRVLIRQAGLSLRLFRRVKKVLVAENTDPAATVFALEAASRRPWAVLGHQRYGPGLEEYALRHPGVMVSIVQDAPVGEENAETGAAELVYSDTRLNSWRMGRAAALLADENQGTVLVFQDGGDFPVNREVFLAGLREDGGEFDLIILNSASGYGSWGPVSCVVLGGPAGAYLDRKDSIPGIFYTWMDPALSPSRVKIIVDDSVWALALQCFSPRTGAPRLLQADFSVPRGRGDAELRKKLKNAVLEQIPGMFPWEI